MTLTLFSIEIFRMIVLTLFFNLSIDQQESLYWPIGSCFGSRQFNQQIFSDVLITKQQDLTKYAKMDSRMSTNDNWDSSNILFSFELSQLRHLALKWNSEKRETTRVCQIRDGCSFELSNNANLFFHSRWIRMCSIHTFFSLLFRCVSGDDDCSLTYRHTLTFFSFFAIEFNRLIRFLFLFI